MNNSQAYHYLIEQIDATGSKKLDGYYPKIMEEIYDWEREEVEDIIWKTFHKNNDTDLAKFLPKFKKYDGIKALKEALQKCSIPSGNSVDIAEALYKITGDIYYLNIIKINYDQSDNKLPIVAMMSYCTPSEEIYRFLVDVYINNENSTIRSTAADGILFNKGYIKDPHNLQEMISKVEMSRLFVRDNLDERKDVIKSLESGEFEKFK